MFCGDYQVLLPSIGGHPHPVGCIEAHRIEALCQRGVFLYWNLLAAHHPLAAVGLVAVDAGQFGVDAPVDEHAEFGIPEPLQALRHIHRSSLRRRSLPAADAAEHCRKQYYFPRKHRMPFRSSLANTRCSPEARFLICTVPAAASSAPVIEKNGMALRSA